MLLLIYSLLMQIIAFAQSMLSALHDGNKKKEAAPRQKGVSLFPLWYHKAHHAFMQHMTWVIGMSDGRVSALITHRHI